jgi:hypothetical protein
VGDRAETAGRSGRAPTVGNVFDADRATVGAPEAAVDLVGDAAGEAPLPAGVPDGGDSGPGSSRRRAIGSTGSGRASTEAVDGRGGGASAAGTSGPGDPEAGTEAPAVASFALASCHGRSGIRSGTAVGGAAVSGAPRPARFGPAAWRWTGDADVSAGSSVNRRVEASEARAAADGPIGGVVRAAVAGIRELAWIGGATSAGRCPRPVSDDDEDDRETVAGSGANAGAVRVSGCDAGVTVADGATAASVRTGDGSRGGTRDAAPADVAAADGSALRAATGRSSSASV